jgi:hypothetical protein
MDGSDRSRAILEVLQMVLTGSVDAFDVSRIDVEPPSDNDLARTVAQEQIAALVEDAEVTGVQPAVDDGFGRLVRHRQLAGHDQVASHDHFA